MGPLETRAAQARAARPKADKKESMIDPKTGRIRANLRDVGAFTQGKPQ